MRYADREVAGYFAVLLFGIIRAHLAQMLDTIFKLFDQSWFGLLLSTALALYSVILTIRMATRQHLSFVTAEGTVLEPAHPSWKDDLSIRYKGVDIPRLMAARIGVWNSGNTTIYSNQIVDDDRLRFEIRDGEQLLSFHVSAMSRPVVKASVKGIGSTSLAVDFDFLDPGDGFVLFIAHTSPINTIKSAGTVRGLSSGATPWTKHNSYRLMVASDLLTGPLLCVILYLVFSAVRKLASVTEGSQTSVVMTLAFLILVTFAMFFSKSASRGVNSLILRRVPKVISNEEGLRIRLMSGK